MSTAIFHFLFCFRILLVIIERNPCRFLSKVHTKSSCLKGTMTTMGTWRMPRPPVPLFWECVCFCSWLGGSRIPIDTTCAFYTPIHTQPAGLVGLGCWPDQLVPWQESVALRGPDGGLGVSIDCWTTSSDFVKQARHQLQLAAWWVTLGMR